MPTLRPQPTVTAFTLAGTDLDHLVALVEKIRPSWEPALVRLVLIGHREHVNGADLCIAALRAARDENLPSPKSIGWRGPHWDGLATRPPQVERHDVCGVCQKIEPRCYTERPGADDDHAFEPTRPTRR